MKKTIAALFLFASLALQISCSIAMPSPSPVPSSAPTPSPVPNADAAIALVKSQFTEVARINKTAAGAIGRSQDITVLDRADGWDLVFWQGDGDCPAGCINNRYWYFSVKKDGRVSKAGEYARVYNPSTNAFEVSGSPLWGVPR